MRKIRNPRYAPESLERKLSPSGGFFVDGFGPPAPPAQVSMRFIEPTPPTEIPPGDPIGPAGPA